MAFHVRRKDKELVDPSDLKKILKSSQYVTLAMSANNQPYLVSLSHGYDEEHNCIYFHGAPEGKKLEYLRTNNAVWGQALLDHGYSQRKCTHLYASVHFSGRVTLLTDPEEKIHGMLCAMKQLDKNPEGLAKRLSPESVQRVTVGRIDIDHMTGKKSAEVTV